jgi:hypothetical protein
LALAVVVPSARAQTNIDQGKTPAEIFANACAVCHKSTRGLADGKNSLMLSGFLQEHYTASRAQAGALAAYVLASGGSGPAPPVAAQKPNADHARAAVEEPKNGEPKNGEPKTTTHPLHQTAKHEETPTAAKPEGQKEEELKPRAEPSPAGSSSGTTVGSREAPQPPASAEPIPGLESAPPAQQSVVATPKPGETPAAAQAPDPDLNPAPSTTALGETQPSDGASVPRDNIPD